MKQKLNLIPVGSTKVAAGVIGCAKCLSAPPSQAMGGVEVCRAVVENLRLSMLELYRVVVETSGCF